MKRKNIKIEEKISTTGDMGKKVLLSYLIDDIDNIQSVSSTYYKINNEERFKITVVVSKEPHFEDID